MLRLVGKPREVHIVEFSIAPPRAGGRKVGGRWLNRATPPFAPRSSKEPFHPGGNSLCYAIQWALLMGADPIRLLGFTLQSGSPYEHGPNNPISQKPSFYDVARAVDFLRWVEATYPGRVRLEPGWPGPLVDIFATERYSAPESKQEVRSDAPQHQSALEGGDPAARG